MQSKTYEALRFEIEDAVATLTFNRPEKLNAINRLMAAEICDALAGLSDARVLIVTGNERAFSAGADLSERSSHTGPSPTLAAYDALAAVSIPIIAAIEGYALGGGLEMAMCCDMRIASETAQLGQPEVLRGILPGGGGTQRLPRLIGPGRAKDLMFTGRHISGATAEQWGLVNRATRGERHSTRRKELAENWRFRVVRWLYARSRCSWTTGSSCRSMRRSTRTRASRLFNTTEDAAEGIRAFLERRPPAFEGK